MGDPLTLTTERLLLRQWRPADLAPFAALNADPRVMANFIKPLSRTESDALAARCEAQIAEHGWGIWALELRDSGQFIGMTGLSSVVGVPDEDAAAGVELVWRLAPSAWGFGYATEAANTALEVGFTKLGLETVLAFTALRNQRSIAVMRRLGMTDLQQNFQHPRIDPHSTLCEHVQYRLTRADYFRQRAEADNTPD